METPPSSPGYAGYARPLPPRGIRVFETVTEAWELFKANPGLWIGCTLVVAAVQLLIYAAIFAVTFQFPAAQDFTSGNYWLFSILSNSIQYGIFGSFFGALTRMGVRQIQGETVQFGEMFYGFRRFGPMIVVGFATSLISTLSMLALCLPYFIVNGLLALAPAILLMDDVGPIEAMKRSFDASKNFLWSMTGLWTVVLLLVFASILCFGVGVLAGFPLWPLSFAVAYRDLFLRQEGFAVTPMPPSPMAGYG